MQKTVNLLTKSALGFGLVLALTACVPNSTPREISVSSAPVDKLDLQLPEVDEIFLRPVEWTIITEENMDEKFAEWNEIGKPFALFVLSGEGYENLGLNISDIRALLQQQQQIIAAYESYYKSDKTIVTEE